jgi:hypothetical protein
MAMLQERVTMKEVHGTEFHVTSATGRKTVKNMKTGNNTAYDKWLCVRMILKIMQLLAWKRFCQ